MSVRRIPWIAVIRCHTLPEFVADTIDSLFHYASPDNRPLVVLSIDRNPLLRDRLEPAYPQVLFHVVNETCGWGGGLYRLFARTMSWLLNDLQLVFNYLWLFDYDAVPLVPCFEIETHQRMDRTPGVGQMGRRHLRNPYWVGKMRQAEPVFKQNLRRSGYSWPHGYQMGDHNAGALNVYSGNCLAKMNAMGMFSHEHILDLPVKSGIADDPYISFMVQVAGYQIADIGPRPYLRWKMTEDYRDVLQRDYSIFHPTKLEPGHKPYSILREKECRDYLRARRGAEPIVLYPDTGQMAYPHNVS